MRLNDTQIKYVLQQLEMELEYEPLREELLDHICCSIEQQLQNGQNFSTACRIVFAGFGENGLQKLEAQTLAFIQPKIFNMKKVLLFTGIFCCLTLTLIWAFPLGTPLEEAPLSMNEEACEMHDPPEIIPIQKGYSYRLSSGFGQRMHPIQKVKKFHKGIDYAADFGTPVVATADGEVVKVENKKMGYGKRIVIQHDEDYQTSYSQLSAYRVEVGQVVKQGEVIGLVGSSGASTNPHLHYEVMKNGENVDPADYIAARVE